MYDEGFPTRVHHPTDKVQFPPTVSGKPEALHPLDEDTLWEIAIEVDDERGSDEPFFTVVDRLFPDVCPTSLLDPDAISWVNRETMVHTYHQTLYPGSMMEQPNRVIQILQTVRSAKDDFQMRKMKDTTKGGGGK